MESMELYDYRPAKRAYSRVGWSLCTILATSLVVQLALSLIIQLCWPDGCWLTTSSTGNWLLTFLPLYGIAIPAGILLLRGIPAQPPHRFSLGARGFWIFLPICFFLTYSGSIAGNLLSALLSSGEAQNALDEYAMDSNPIKILFIAVLAPLFEEYIFRKLLIDRTRAFGEKTAVFLSALTFGLFHTNLFQFFYAFLVGWVFAYLYIRTGKLRYPVLMHSIINFTGSVVAPWILSLLDLEALSSLDPNATNAEILEVYRQILPGLALYLLYFLLVLGLFIAGLVLLILQRKRLIWHGSSLQIPHKNRFRTVYCNAGMLVLLFLCATLTILSVLL